jgi:AAA+ ATPase superfamily predicted ATPase
MFLARTRELAFLQELHDSPRPEFFVLYGRRRVGKTELLQRFCQGRRAVYFLAAQVREKDNLRALRDALSDALGDPSIASLEFPDWNAALKFAAERARAERLVLVLDEFPYLCEATKGLTSLVQRFWDTTGKSSKLMLVVCGSQVSFMEREVLAERSPLFGRRTAQLRLEPLSPPEALQFLKKRELDERIQAYAILGGMPAYLRRFDEDLPLKDNVVKECLRPEGYLYDEVNFLLRSELQNPATYASLLAAVARGKDKVGDIALEAGVDSPTANKYLTTLRDMGLVEREVPVTDTDPLRSRRGVYRVADRFLAFHFRHIQPHAAQVQAGRGAKVWTESIAHDLPRLVDDARVDFIVHHLRTQAADELGVELVEVGRHDGRYVRACARGSDGSGVAAIVVPPKFKDPEGLGEELSRLARHFQGPLAKLVYGFTRRKEAPLGFERVPEGELL